jgi:hypothetical protein
LIGSSGDFVNMVIRGRGVRYLHSSDAKLACCLPL